VLEVVLLVKVSSYLPTYLPAYLAIFLFVTGLLCFIRLMRTARLQTSVWFHSWRWQQEEEEEEEEIGYPLSSS
jgi:hypothetical protein